MMMLVALSWQRLEKAPTVISVCARSIFDHVPAPECAIANLDLSGIALECAAGVHIKLWLAKNPGKHVQW